jgi:2-polyprenyl-3-methyl-5-hydroxy-6-metoxy-1,4-benzoquinol methylase
MIEERYRIPKTVAIERTIFTENFVTGKDILHIGIGGAIHDLKLKSKFLSSDISNWFHSRISLRAKSIVTLELEQDNIDKFESQVPGEYICGDITDNNITKSINRKFDLIIFTEIIEHLDCYHSALGNIQNLLNPGGQLLISTINAFNIFMFMKLARRYESNHIEHTAYFSYITLNRLLSMNDFSIKEFYFSYDHPKSLFKRIVKLSLMRVFPQYSQGILLIAESSR